MSKPSVQRILSLIPDRIARSQSGLGFVACESACRFPERLTFLAERLHWLSPLEPIDSEARRLLGFSGSAARAGESELDTEAQLDTEPAEEEDGSALDLPA